MTGQIRGADVVARCLAEAQVSVLFSLSGNHVMSVYDAALEAEIELIHVRHEAAAVHMADAWGRLTGTVGVALVTGGPGHANAVAALYTALAAESPVLLLSGHAPLGQLGQGAFQEMRQAELAAPVTKAAWTVASAAQLDDDLSRALSLAVSGRPGPVHLSLPEDVLEARIEPVAGVSRERFQPRPMPLAELAADAVMTALRSAGRPLILAGPMGGTALARERLQTLERVTGIPVVTMASPRGVNDPALGAFSGCLARADCLLLLGKQPDHTLGFLRPPQVAADCRLLQIDPDPGFRQRLAGFAADQGRSAPWQAEADVVSAIQALLARPTARHPATAWAEQVRTAIRYRPPEWHNATSETPGRLHPAELCAVIQPLLDAREDAVLVADGGEFGQWAQACLTAGQRVINGVAGSIGGGLPFALGARVACPDALIILLSGDGSIGFQIGEFDTGVRHDLPVIAVVGSDACWNAEYQIQLRRYGEVRAHGCDLLDTGYERVAAAFGGFGARAESVQELAAALLAAGLSERTACITVPIDGLPAPVIRA